MERCDGWTYDHGCACWHKGIPGCEPGGTGYCEDCVDELPAYCGTCEFLYERMKGGLACAQKTRGIVPRVKDTACSYYVPRLYKTDFPNPYAEEH